MTSSCAWPTRTSSLTAARPLADATVADGNKRSTNPGHKNNRKARRTALPNSLSSNSQPFEEGALPKLNRYTITSAMAPGDRDSPAPRYMGGTTASGARSSVRLTPSSQTRSLLPVPDPAKSNSRFADTKARFGFRSSTSSRKSIGAVEQVLSNSVPQEQVSIVRENKIISTR